MIKNIYNIKKNIMVYENFLNLILNFVIKLKIYNYI